MNRRQRVAHVVTLVVIGACALAVAAVAQDGSDLAGLRGSLGSDSDVGGAGGRAHVAGGEAAESDGAAAAITKTAREPQLVIWTDALTNYLPTAAHSTMHDEFIVGWTTQQDQWSHDIWARRLRPDGTLLEHFNVATSAGDWLVQPAIAYCPLHDEYLIAYTNWHDNSGPADVEARRVAWNGGWMSDIFTVSPGVAKHFGPSIAHCGPCDEYVVTYTNEWPGGERDLYAQRVRASDGVLLSWSCVATGGGWQRAYSRVAFHPAMYGGAGGYLIAYTADDYSTGAKTLRYKITHTDLYDLYANPELDVSSTSDAVYGLAIASGQTGFLAAWWDSTTGGFQVRARRITADGVALGPPEGFPVSGVYGLPPPSFELAVTYAYPGLYLVFWEHGIPSGITDIHGIFVSEDADTTVGDETVLSGNGNPIYAPAAICSPMSDCLIVYQWWNPPSDDIAGDIARLRWVFSDGYESGDTSAWSATVP